MTARTIPLCTCFMIALLTLCARGEITLDTTGKFEPLPKELKQVWLTERDARFTRQTNTFSWISDIEHVTFPRTNVVYLADAEPAYYFCGAVVPGGTFFELFPYHWYVKKEEAQLGGRISYRLVAKNINSREVTLEMEGAGTTRDWDHERAWAAALRGDGRRIIRLKAGEIITLWEEREIVGDFPWSGIFLGRASGDLWVCDYAWLGKKDPGIEKARPMPDLSQPPVAWPSFTRGTAGWNAATIEVFPLSRTPSGRIALAQVESASYSFAIADSPGGPTGKLCNYAAVPKTFQADEMPVLDPVSQTSHLFFGGNYPVMYKLPLPLTNDTQSTKTVTLYISSNDKLKVDTLAGVWVQGKMLMRRVPMVGKNEHWKAVEITLAPGRMEDYEATLLPIGSRWGGMVVTLAIASK